VVATRGAVAYWLAMTAAQKAREPAAPVASAHEKILIVDFGSQVTQLIARRVREEGVYSEIVPFQKAEAAFREMKPKAVILSGGPESVHEEGSPRAPQAIFDSGVPVLGICYGQMTMAAQLGGEVEGGHHREFGRADVEVKGDSLLFDATWSKGGKYQVWMSHGDRITKMPPGFSVAGTSPNAPFAVIQDEKRKYYGLMFHPEVVHTPDGAKLLRNFVRKIAGLHGDWTMRAFRAEAIEKIRRQVGKGKVICGLSGGVDSAVAAVLIHEAIGDQLTCVFVDHGLLRLNEGAQVMETFGRHLGVRVIHVDATAEFMGELAGVSDPEAKRKIIGREFVEVFQRESKKIDDARWLAQGTIYPDVIESAGAKKKAHTIKSHHNVGGLPDTLHLKLLEPLRELFKDEVRELGVALGLPREMVYRHPFPGPGLGVRILGEVSMPFADLLRRADAIFIDELRGTTATERDAAAGLCTAEEVGRSWYDLTSQAFAVFLPVKSVGVMGDGRTYEYVVALRAVQTQDFMTAHWAHLPHELLGRVSNRIINEVRGINRVVYDISGKPPATIEWE